MQTLAALRTMIAQYTSPIKAKNAQRFFKTGPGHYGEGDQFLWLTVPESRTIAKQFLTSSIAMLSELICSPRHEERLIALIIVVSQYQKTKDEKLHKQLFDRYIAHKKYINNWDLIDGSAEHIVGPYLQTKDKKILYTLLASESIRDRRIAILATFHYIKQWDPSLMLDFATRVLSDKHDLIQKATGWMLREIGKRCGEKYLTDFLDIHYKIMPRMMLRYAIERLDTTQKKYYMHK